MTDKDKLEKLKKLADAMYYAAGNLGPNVGSGERLRKTMKEYHQFIINEYHKEEPVSIDFEQELYKAFGQVKDFTLGMRIAKWFYDMGKNSQEPVSEDLEEAIDTYLATYFGGEKEKRNWPSLKKMAIHFAASQKQQIMKGAKLSGWIARDEDGTLHVFEIEPRRIEEKGRWWDRDYQSIMFDKCEFPNLTWEDEPQEVKLIIIKED